MKIAFNSANLVGRVTDYRFQLAEWGKQHARTVRETDAKAFAQICGEIAATGSWRSSCGRRWPIRR